MSHNAAHTHRRARPFALSLSVLSDRRCSLLDFRHPPLDVREKSVDFQTAVGRDVRLVQVLTDGRDPLHQRVVLPLDRVHPPLTLPQSPRDGLLLLVEPLLQPDEPGLLFSGVVRFHGSNFNL